MEETTSAGTGNATTDATAEHHPTDAGPAETTESSGKDLTHSIFLHLIAVFVPLLFVI